MYMNYMHELLFAKSSIVVFFMSLIFQSLQY